MPRTEKRCEPYKKLLGKALMCAGAQKTTVSKGRMGNK